jgi:hypothetical protein
VRVVVVASVFFAVMLLATTASATTGPDEITKVTVTLTDGGVRFSRKLHLTTQSTLALHVVNKSSTRRSFAISYRKSGLIQRGGFDNFYFTPYVSGRAIWRSVGRGGKAFSGWFPVRFVTIYG